MNNLEIQVCIIHMFTRSVIEMNVIGRRQHRRRHGHKQSIPTDNKENSNTSNLTKIQPNKQFPGINSSQQGTASHITTIVRKKNALATLYVSTFKNFNNLLIISLMQAGLCQP